MPDINLQRRIKRHIQAAEHDFFAVTAPGLEQLCADELTPLGDADIAIFPGGVSFRGRLESMYLANLWLRTAGRVLMRLADFRVRTWADLARQGGNILWELLLPPDGCAMEIRVSLHESNLKHTGRIAEELHVAAAKRMEQAGLRPPTLALPGQPALAVQVRGVDRRASISLDTSGEHLHRRGYRLATAKAPLRETLGAALLMHCEYDGNETLLDPMCGAGTLPIEAAMLARRLPPGLCRQFAFELLAAHRLPTWQHMVRTAREQALPEPPAPIFAADMSGAILGLARENAQRAGVADSIRWAQADFFQATPPPAKPGLLVINPPYGRRLGSVDEARRMIQRIGQRLATHYKGWRCGVVLYMPQWADELGLEEIARLEAPHGGLKVTMLHGRVPD